MVVVDDDDEVARGAGAVLVEEVVRGAVDAAVGVWVRDAAAVGDGLCGPVGVAVGVPVGAVFGAGEFSPRSHDRRSTPCSTAVWATISGIAASLFGAACGGVSV